MEEGFEHALALLPPAIRGRAAVLGPGVRSEAEELRLRLGRAPTVLLGTGERALRTEPVTAEELAAVLDAATESSFHTAEDALRKGFITARGGVRVGVCGTAVTEGRITGLRDISSLSLRVPRQLRGVGDGVLEQLQPAASVLILSPPGAGKTTLLRELVRRVSDAGVRVGLADERNELAAVWRGVPQFDVGRCTDVLTGAPKAEAAMALLRAMNPQVVAMDELTAPEDAAAAERLSGCGVGVFATVHAEGPEALARRPVWRRLLDAGIFQAAVVIRRGPRRSYRVAAL